VLIIKSAAMPTAKPDQREVNELRKRRGITYVDPVSRHFAPLYEACREATEGGYITEKRAIYLLQHLRSQPSVAAIYPNNVLIEILTESTAPGNWSLDVEHDLLHTIFSFYLGYEADESMSGVTRVKVSSVNDVPYVSSMPLSYEPRPPSDLSVLLTYTKLKSARWQHSLLSGYVDRSVSTPDLRDKFVGFTGKFAFGAREACFQAARRLGAVPCDPSPFMDYLFVSTEYEEQCAVSNKLSSAIYCRRLYGNPLILPERLWEDAAGVKR
jgi:hypothetical protein